MGQWLHLSHADHVCAQPDTHLAQRMHQLVCASRTKRHWPADQVQLSSMHVKVHGTSLVAVLSDADNVYNVRAQSDMRLTQRMRQLVCASRPNAIGLHLAVHG